MARQLRLHVRGAREDGAALPLALGFLIVFGLLIGVILGFASSSLLSSRSLDKQRNAVYAVNSAVDAAIARVRSNANAGTASDTALCAAAVNGIDKNDVNVTCLPNSDSGTSLGGTSAPGFAILTMSPFTALSPSSWSGNTPPQCINVSSGELGIVQVQNSKLLRITGDVYVNSDADSDIWSGGCPQTTTAQHIQVEGNIKQRESCHDLDPINDSFLWRCGDGTATPQNGTHPDGPLGNTADAQLNDPAIANPAAWAALIAAPPAVQAVPACNVNNPVVTFTPGTYNDVTAFNTLMGGGCANHVFYFPSGVYYFDFANAVGGHEWTINDGTARVVGGQPNGTPVGAITVGPTTWKPSTTANVAGSVNFTNPANATSIDGVAATVPALAAGQTARITLSGYATAPASTIPANATIDSVRLRVAHNEATPANVGTPTVTITSQGSPACAAVNITKRAALGEDAAPSYDVTGCLNSPTKLNSPVSLVYAVPGTATSAIGLDGIWLDVTYTTATRPAWDPTNPATVNAGSPAVPGSCRRDGDAGWTDGVQFVFGGDSHINLKSGAFELCDKPSSTQQEIVLYGVKSASGGGTVVGPRAWIAQNFTNGASGFTNPTNGRVVDGTPATAQVTSAIPNRTMTLTQFSPTTWPIPGVDQIPANATNIQASLAVTHWESNTSQTNNPQIAVTPSGAGACATQTLSEHLVGDANKTDTVDVSSCLNTPSKLNGGLSVLFTARRSSSSPTENLDGMALSVTYTVPSGGGGGGLTPESGCVVQKPYYSTVDHSPAFNGACALFRVSSNSAGGASPRTVAFWGTVYAPSAALDIQVDVLTVPVFNRGVVARMLMLGYNVQLPQLVPITTTPVVDVQHRNRRMTFTATIAGRSTKAVADVEFCDVSCAAPTSGVNPPIKIYSWKVSR